MFLVQVDNLKSSESSPHLELGRNLVYSLEETSLSGPNANRRPRDGRSSPFCFFCFFCCSDVVRTWWTKD